jgi:hypothetical protein
VRDMDQLQGAVTLPDGTPVRGRGRRERLPPGPLPEYGLTLGRTQRAWSPAWPEIRIAWPDFGLPRDRAHAAAAIRDAYALAREGARVEVTCGGGNGRTGTVIACMAVLAGCPPGDAVAWTRLHYRRHAVETPWQRQYVRRFG